MFSHLAPNVPEDWSTNIINICKILCVGIAKVVTVKLARYARSQGLGLSPSHWKIICKVY